MLKRLLRPLALRYRNFMQAEIMAEISALKQQRENLTEALSHLQNLSTTITATEAALVTLALQQSGPEA
jgi:prefoldin subunit 5